jgi:hypothetical protein
MYRTIHNAWLTMINETEKAAARQLEYSTQINTMVVDPLNSLIKELENQKKIVCDALYE